MMQDRVHNWDGFRFSTGEIEWFVSPDIGGRILSITVDGRELLFVQKEHAGETFDFSGVTDLALRKKEIGFRLWGGDKTWIAPQNEWLEGIPPLDLDASPYSHLLDGEAIVMESPVCRETGLSIKRRISPASGNGIRVEQTITNRSDRPVRKAIWDVTQMVRPFDVWIRSPIERVRPYPEEGGSERYKSDVVLEQDGYSVIRCDAPLHFKYGATPDGIGEVIAVKRGGPTEKTVVHTRNFALDPGAPFAHGSCVEVYNSPDYDYMELEIHSPLVTLQPAEHHTHEQIWHFFTFDGTPAIEELLAAIQKRNGEKGE